MERFLSAEQAVMKLARDEFFRSGFVAGAEAHDHLAMVTARLKPCPYYKAGFHWVL
jgi:hypothetical protein